ncbi:hypothetical protein SAMN05421823_10915 [Catalinimonas alkaloidigena]|uniref:Uncharacterized protein n=1 Tax=Catalinimonas alkaloidigena TaxID=1075417 RepID=A0A1G9NZ79_9BACT|nr:hypothetical protein SAMN05421823_10915 [Catalinimonas alkaloidigena]
MGVSRSVRSLQNEITRGCATSHTYVAQYYERLRPFALRVTAKTYRVSFPDNFQDAGGHPVTFARSLEKPVPEEALQRRRTPRLAGVTQASGCALCVTPQMPEVRIWGEVLILPPFLKSTLIFDVRLDLKQNEKASEVRLKPTENPFWRGISTPFRASAGGGRAAFLVHVRRVTRTWRQQVGTEAIGGARVLRLPGSVCGSGRGQFLDHTTSYVGRLRRRRRN